MTIRIAINHRTRYDYDRHVELSPQIIRLRPAPHCRTPITGYSLKVSPADHFENWQQDPQGNYLARCVFPNPTDHFEIEVDVVAEMTSGNPFDFFLEPAANRFPFRYESWLLKELGPYFETEPLGPKLQEWLSAVDRTDQDTMQFLIDLNQRLRSEVKYLVRLEPGIQTCEETLAKGSGSCRDSAWLLVQILRRLGLAARFVSGYLVQLVADQKPLEGPEGPLEDFTDLHAWTEVYLPGGGWVGLDPTSGLLASEGHIPLACTPDPTSAAPITGAVSKCESEFQFEMSIQRIHEDPRVTKPYTDLQWQRILAVGDAVDGELRDGDVRLTMGGEPTFVSIDDMDGEEWNTAAVGPTKRQLASELLERMRNLFAPGGLVHCGQGKWYPGEPLPRWALGCYWRSDGAPLWDQTQWLADERSQSNQTVETARGFIDKLSEQLHVGRQWVLEAHEDVWHYLSSEQRLPPNVDLKDPKLRDPEERARLAAMVERGIGAAVGFVLPLQRQWWQAEPRWVSGPWPLRGGNLQLTPGDSPIGLRLPLDSLPWHQHAERYQPQPQDPTAPRPPLRQERGRVDLEPLPEVAPSYSGPEDVIRTALCIEAREGRLHVFMPPTQRLDDYVDLLQMVEGTAAELETPVVVEGYLPPPDHRLQHFKITPDPGVIEVNVQPAASWSELVHNTTTLYEQARLTRLGTEKFDLDGKHTGTGGGNHVVLGGPTPLDSPFLRRPDLLRSLVGYWNNHPSLSYLFSGTFVGPTSQAPRVDEGRQDALHELEIAFQQVPEYDCPPWLVDRIFRHLLVDLTGNTHRAEFCIDKLYSPDSATGRLGLVELRAFEMPPHARMSLTQQLLLRALIARFWRQPYRASLVRWGTTLHDRYLLPHYVWRDFADVVEETRQAGLEVELDWFRPHFEFRFPEIGRIAQRDVELELRQAIEPWYVLGEEPAGGGTSRYVDSSVERLQVRVRGLTDHRHAVTCNGHRVPLHPTGTEAEAVAGVRYRAWQPASCLHPTIGVHTPLVFDVVDTWSGRSIGGCTYHVADPAGRNYETFPVNAAEAESRRAARFFRSGHTGGPLHVAEERIHPDAPLTLDLRRA